MPCLWQNYIENIHELEGVDVLLDGRIDDFIGDCEKCGKFFDIGAKIIKGKIKNVWVLREKETKVL